MVKEMAKRLYAEQKGPEQKMMKNPPNPGCAFGAKGPSNGSGAGTSQWLSTSAILPKLTPTEQLILFDHQGCFKCRQLYVDHKGSDCPNGFPAPGSYKPLTAELAEAVRDSKNRPRPWAAGPVAHVGFTEGVGEKVAVLGVGKEDFDDSDEYVQPDLTPLFSPFFSGHLEWHCRVDGPVVSEPVTVTALIDNGSHSVLIDEQLVSKLGLRRRQLQSPQRARLAMGEGEVVFSEWVKLQLHSRNQQWTAQTVRALVAPGLTQPVILGGLFLESNKIVIDHELGKVTVKDSQFQLIPEERVAVANTPEVTSKTEGCQDERRATLFKELEESTRVRRSRANESMTVGTSHKHFARTLQSRIEILAVWDDLARHEWEVREEYGDRFPADIPHVVRESPPPTPREAYLPQRPERT